MGPDRRWLRVRIVTANAQRHRSVVDRDLADRSCAMGLSSPRHWNHETVSYGNGSAERSSSCLCGWRQCSRDLCGDTTWCTVAPHGRPRSTSPANDVVAVSYTHLTLP